jgi:hypothetical protein
MVSGGGEYRYFYYPLPAAVTTLRTSLYPRPVPITNRWHERMGPVSGVRLKPFSLSSVAFTSTKTRIAFLSVPAGPIGLTS